MLISWNKYCNATVGLFIEEFSDAQLESFGFFGINNKSMEKKILQHLLGTRHFVI